MEKQEILNEISKAKNSHVLWFANAMALSVGTNPGDESVPKLHTNCIFGKWYYGLGQELNHLDSFKSIGDVHEDLHKKYNDIFNNFEKLMNENFFEDISQRSSQKQKDFNFSIEELKEISKKLLEILSELEKDVNSL